MSDIFISFGLFTNLTQGQKISHVAANLVVPRVGDLKFQLQELSAKDHCKFIASLQHCFETHMWSHEDSGIF